MLVCLLTPALQILTVAPSILGIGQPARYLVLFMDRSELRPGGGFQGNFGILTMDGGRPSTSAPLTLQDVYQLDQRYYQNPKNADPSACPDSSGLSVVGPQPPSLYWWWPIRCFSDQYGWGLRDANLSPDFPTNARTALQIAEASGWLPAGTTLNGVIAVTPTLIEQVLEVTGPLDMSAYHVTVTAQNLEHEIHEFQLGAAGAGQPDRKAFTRDLGKALLGRLQHLSAPQLLQLVGVAHTALQTKDLQVYFTDARSEQLLSQHGLASAIATSGDGFYVTDTNDGGNKANAYVTETQTDVVTLLPNGDALHRLRIVVTYDKRGPVYEGTTGFADYSDVQRTYLPGNATNISYSQPAPIFSNGECTGLLTPETDCTPGHVLDASAPLTNSDVPGRAMVMQPFIVPCGSAASLLQYDAAQDYADCITDPQPHTHTVYINWVTPHAYNPGAGDYTELIQKQPGTTLALTDGEQGSQVQLAVYVTKSQQTATTDATFDQLLAGATRIYAAPLVSDTLVRYTPPGA